MQQTALKQVLFLIGSAFILVLLMGLFLFTNSNAEPASTVGIASPSPSLQLNLEGNDWDDWDDWDEDEDWDENKDWEDWMSGDRSSVFARYNRVEGFTIGTRLKKEYWRSRRPSSPFIYGHWAYAFGAKEFQYRAGVEKGVFDDFRFAVGGEYHHMIDTEDKWIISESENSLAASMIKEDFHDFYQRDGGSGYIMQNLTDAITLTGTYSTDKWSSVKKHVNWSLFGGKKKFRENPAIDEGEARSVSASVLLDTRNSKKRTTRGWYVHVEGEHTGDDLGGDFTYDRVVADFRRFQPLGYYDGIDIRIRGGSSTGCLPWHKRYYLGGLSTLRGYRYKAFPAKWDQPGANRMLLAQIEYRLGKQDLPDEIDLGLLEQFYLILFADAGWLASVDKEMDLMEGFEDLEPGDFKSDVGIALANRSGNVRFEIARRTDTSYKPIMLWFRLNRPF